VGLLGPQKTILGKIKFSVEGYMNLMLAQANVMGLGSCLASLPVYAVITTAFTKIPGPAYISAAIATTLLAALCGFRRKRHRVVPLSMGERYRSLVT
jgi:H+/gluconate symporter-like permease